MAVATRPVFIPLERYPYVMTRDITFEWHPGFAKIQGQRNVRSLHRSFMRLAQGAKVLEISSKSVIFEPGSDEMTENEAGIALSAFNLRKLVPSRGYSIPVENVYHGGKVFKYGGPFTDLMNEDVTPSAAKRDERLKNHGPIIGFKFEDMEFPINPPSLFYDFLYINALLENEEKASCVLAHDTFTDIVYNPNKSVGCQARSAAIFVALNKMGLIDNARTFEGFLKLFNADTAKRLAPMREAAPATPAKPESAPQATTDTQSLSVGDTIVHKAWGEGVVKEINGSIANVSFASVGEKKMGVAWIVQNCDRSE